MTKKKSAAAAKTPKIGDLRVILAGSEFYDLTKKKNKEVAKILSKQLDVKVTAGLVKKAKRLVKLGRKLAELAGDAEFAKAVIDRATGKNPAAE
jgi:ABC-type phosphate/phosphonate transport system substrate-binding protein